MNKYETLEQPIKATSNPERTKFEAGMNVSTRSICDHNCIYKGVIISRTEKTVTIKTAMEGVKRCKIFIDGDGGEYIMPFGKYSMAPSFRATKQYK